MAPAVPEALAADAEEAADRLYSSLQAGAADLAAVQAAASAAEDSADLAAAPAEAAVQDADSKIKQKIPGNNSPEFFYINNEITAFS